MLRWAAAFSVLLSVQCAHREPGRVVPGSSSAPAASGEWCSAPQLPSNESKHGVSGALSELNGRFLEAHARARLAACEQLQDERLVLRYSFGLLEARYKGRRLHEGTINVIPEAYHPLKDVSHAVFTVALVMREGSGSERTAHAREVLGATAAVLAELNDPTSKASQLIPPEHRDRQIRLLDATKAALIDLVEGRLDEDAQRDYFARVRPDVIENLRVVAAALVRGLHERVQEFRAIVERDDPAAWDALVVVVAVVHQARAREIGVQYFERLVGETMGEGASQERRLVVAESVFQGPEQYGLMAAHLVDQVGAADVFGDPFRLQRDALADDGGMLDTLLPRAPRRE